MKSDDKVIIIGAGPAGLSVAYYLIKNTDLKPVIIEETPYIGGISRTHNHNGNRMDLGGHRFFSKSDEVLNFWKEIFPVQEMPSKDEILLANADEKNNFQKAGVNPETQDEVLLKRHRLSRIYFLRKFFDYPISFKPETFINMGFFNVIKAGVGYLYSCVKKRKENSLEDFYINRFGKPLYSMFFEDYTRKVWGIHPSKISPDWGTQRVKGLSLITVLKNCLLKPFLKKEKVETSLIEEFLYPKMGPGQLYEAVADKIKQNGGQIILNNKVVSLNFNRNKISSIVTVDENGNENTFDCDVVFSSMPIKDLVSGFKIEVPQNIKETAEMLPYRDFMTVGLLVKKFAIKNKSKYKTVSNIIPDCWIYIQEKNVKLGRLQIFNNWSPYMVKDLENTVWLGLEYFCSEGDEMWNMQDSDFIKTASDELEKIGIINKNDVLDSVVIRVKKAYPAYFGAYKNFEIVKDFVNSIQNLYCVGRNGQHRYNNMDHSILTGFEAAKAYISGTDKRVVWNVNTENEYHEEKKEKN